MTQFPAQLSPEFMFYDKCYMGGTDHATGIYQHGRADRNGRSVPSILFFNKIHHRHRLDTSIYYFRRVREPYLAILCPSGSFFAPASTARVYIDHAIWIHRLGRADKRA